MRITSANETETGVYFHSKTSFPAFISVDKRIKNFWAL